MGENEEFNILNYGKYYILNISIYKYIINYIFVLIYY